MPTVGIATILPDTVTAVESFGELPEAVLFPEEERVVRRAVPERRNEFATARHCARIGLGRLGLPPVAIPSGKRREPVWPPGVTGSLTHCTGYRAAAVARSRDVASVGIDAEPNEPLPAEIRDATLHPVERESAASLPRTGIHWDRLLFSAKEAIYKAWYPLTGAWLDFDDAVVTVECGSGGRSGGFSARLRLPDSSPSGSSAPSSPNAEGPPRRRWPESFRGAWARTDALLLSAVVTPR